MTIANDLVHPDPTKRRFNRTLVRAAYTAKPDDLVACQSSSGAITVTLPSTVSAGTCIAVGDDDDDAETNAITIASAATIDGEASITISQDGGLEIFIFTGSIWMRIGASRLVSAAARDVPVLSLDWIKKALATPAGWSFGHIWSPVDLAIAMPGGLGFNETYGYYFRVDVPMTLLGARISSGNAGAGRQFQIKAWLASGPTELASKTGTATSNNEDMSILFDAPLALTRQTNGERYVVSIRCLSANYVPFANVTIANGTLNVGSTLNPSTWPVYVMPKVLFHTFAWVGGTAFPSTPIGSAVPAIEPILEYV
jgi:hypothetical protein